MSNIILQQFSLFYVVLRYAQQIPENTFAIHQADFQSKVWIPILGNSILLTQCPLTFLLERANEFLKNCCLDGEWLFLL